MRVVLFNGDSKYAKIIYLLIINLIKKKVMVKMMIFHMKDRGRN